MQWVGPPCILSKITLQFPQSQRIDDVRAGPGLTPKSPQRGRCNPHPNQDRPNDGSRPERPGGKKWRVIIRELKSSLNEPPWHVIGDCRNRLMA
jgi:hypothetical protein